MSWIIRATVVSVIVVGVGFDFAAAAAKATGLHFDGLSPLIPASLAVAAVGVAAHFLAVWTVHDVSPDRTPPLGWCAATPDAAPSGDSEYG